MTTSEAHITEANRLLSVARRHFDAGELDYVAPAAALAQGYFAAAAATNAVEMIRAAAAPILPPVDPNTVLVAFLRACRDLDVRTHEGAVVAFDAVDTAVTDFAAAIARTAERAGLVTESDTGRWVLAPRGREAADRGQL